MQISTKDILAVLGEKEMMIVSLQQNVMALQAQVQQANKRIAELEPKKADSGKPAPVARPKKTNGGQPAPLGKAK